jgi:hypothetical protein
VANGAISRCSFVAHSIDVDNLVFGSVYIAQKNRGYNLVFSLSRVILVVEIGQKNSIPTMMILLKSKALLQIVVWVSLSVTSSLWSE